MSDETITRATGAKQARKLRLDDPLAHPGILRTIVARCSSPSLAASYGRASERASERASSSSSSSVRNLPTPASSDRHHDRGDLDDDDVGGRSLQPATLKADLYPILMADSSDDDDEDDD
mmetsp:Transcript_3199/g.9804  ORF Transcript_3199/g.9804 Transcript_3199/m.9804 type:complete len:120 (-) Transcript_3199:100-459(-)